MTKKILFVSSSDFKEKSIQVIRKTPEAYRDRGWEVHYVVGRDTSKEGDYFYEKIFSPEGIHVYRFMIPLAAIHGLFGSSIWKAVWFRIRTILFVLGLAFKAIKVLREQKGVDVIYGYEVPGVLACRLVRFLGYAKQTVFVTRFQGVLHVKEWLRLGQRLRALTNWEAIMALRTKADLVVLTNDGSQGLDVLNRLNAPRNKVLFYVNGVDKVSLDQRKLEEVKTRFYDRKAFYMVSVSRLDHHKRLDRGIRIINALVKNYQLDNVHYVIIGGGVEEARLRALIGQLKLNKYVTMAGPLSHNDVPYHLACSEVLISMYTSTNVGNPLLEAIRNNKPVVTLNNGDTADWIQHKVNGYIYDVDDVTDLTDEDYLQIAGDIRDLIEYPEKLAILKKNLLETEQSKLWTWERRFDSEIKEVNALTYK